MKLRTILFAAAIIISMPLGARERTLHVVATGDIHGQFFDQPYVEGGRNKTSLMSVKYYVDSLRSAVGKENVLLLDAGDFLQGDNAAYYYNYVAVNKPHIYPRLASYMGYDAVVVGNHDIETGHAVYDRVHRELNDAGIAFLSANYDHTDGRDYFPSYSCFKRGGMKVLVLGFGNANIKGWLSEELWKGMNFDRIAECAQMEVNRAVAAEKPDVVIVAVHSGTGSGENASIESEGMELLRTLKGVDVLVTAHDHNPVVVGPLPGAGTILVNGGARCANVAHATVSVKGKRRSVSGEIVRLNKNKVDVQMRELFKDEFEQVKAFTNREVGELAMPLRTRDAYTGMCDYLNLVHSVCLSVPEVQIAFNAPLTFNGSVKPGTIIYNDMFTIYPFENTLNVIRMSGQEVKDYLEYSYDSWIQTPGEHVLKIKEGADARTGSSRWAFVNRSYNFDSAAGLVYTVDVTKPYGERVSIQSMADGSAFDPAASYTVAMTSYRANGGGGILSKGAGIDNAEMQRRVVALYPEIREMVYRYIRENKKITPELIGNPAVIGSWKFVPESVANPLLEKDIKLIF